MYGSLHYRGGPRGDPDLKERDRSRGHGIALVCRPWWPPVIERSTDIIVRPVQSLPNGRLQSGTPAGAQEGVTEAPEGSGISSLHDLPVWRLRRRANHIDPAGCDLRSANQLQTISFAEHIMTTLGNRTRRVMLTRLFLSLSLDHPRRNHASKTNERPGDGQLWASRSSPTDRRGSVIDV
jgi:hypothetical protein